MKLFLTGVTGFVGRNLLLRVLQEARYETIYVPVRSKEKFRAQLQGDGFDEIPSRVIPVEASAPGWDFSSLPAVDHVVHSAGVLFANTREEYFRTNVDGTLQLLRTLKVNPNSRTILLSSQAAAGPTSQMPRKEDHPETPLTWYGESKLEMERKVAAEFGAESANPRPYIVIRPPMVFGPRDTATLPLFKMTKFPLRFKPGSKIKHFSYIAVNDLIDAFLLALEAPDWAGVAGRSYFVASAEPVSDEQLIRLVGESQKRRGYLVRLPNALLWGVSQVVMRVPSWSQKIPNLSADRVREIWPDSWVVSSEAFSCQFRWRPREELTKTLELTRDWYQKTKQI